MSGYLVPVIVAIVATALADLLDLDSASELGVLLAGAFALGYLLAVIGRRVSTGRWQWRPERLRW